jgi:hypothetical protein
MTADRARVIGLVIWARIDDQRQRSFVTGYPVGRRASRGRMRKALLAGPQGRHQLHLAPYVLPTRQPSRCAPGLTARSSRSACLSRRTPRGHQPRISATRAPVLDIMVTVSDELIFTNASLARAAGCSTVTTMISSTVAPFCVLGSGLCVAVSVAFLGGRSVWCPRVRDDPGY